MATTKKEVTLEEQTVFVKEPSVLETRIQELEKEKAGLLKTAEELRNSEHSVRKEIDKVKDTVNVQLKTIEGQKTQIELLRAELNKLAKLFDEYVTAYQDQNKLLQAFVRTGQIVESSLQQKIEQFNKGPQIPETKE